MVDYSVLIIQFYCNIIGKIMSDNQKNIRNTYRIVIFKFYRLYKKRDFKIILYYHIKNDII